jgi:hypothetical protein
MVACCDAYALKARERSGLRAGDSAVARIIRRRRKRSSRALKGRRTSGRREHQQARDKQMSVASSETQTNQQERVAPQVFDIYHRQVSSGTLWHVSWIVRSGNKGCEMQRWGGRKRSNDRRPQGSNQPASRSWREGKMENGEWKK